MSETALLKITTDRYIYWRKIYTFFAVGLISTFVIFWTHFGHHLGSNDDNYVDFIDWTSMGTTSNASNDDNLNILKKSQELKDTPPEQIEEQTKDIHKEEVNEKLVAEEETKDKESTENDFESIVDTNQFFKNHLITISLKVHQIESDQVQIKDSIVNIDDNQENIGISLKELTDRVDLMDENILDIKESVADIQSKLNLILANQNKGMRCQGLSNSPKIVKKVLRNNQ